VDRQRRRHHDHRGAARWRARAGITVTGQLGDVMRESVDAAYSVRAVASLAARHQRLRRSRKTISTSIFRRAPFPRMARARASRSPWRSPAC
jgi:hypothetical protein